MAGNTSILESRTILPGDAVQYQGLRVKALTRNPEAFAETVEEQLTLKGQAHSRG